ncbi:hypothetical protein JG688_00004890 [Phytophthora aleatoria]|uniref:Uncharacterized protein n=1 Tax=Phytophthora aleatoria TaxID=2496075 RepID=A0A8J5M8Z9_9STRA|nr:hypothetical protein JG688_00004890 [Phytophthora aleatoria]
MIKTVSQPITVWQPSIITPKFDALVSSVVAIPISQCGISLKYWEIEHDIYALLGLIGWVILSLKSDHFLWYRTTSAMVGD